MIIYHTPGIRIYLKKGIIYIYTVATNVINPSILTNSKTILKSIKRI